MATWAADSGMVLECDPPRCLVCTFRVEFDAGVYLGHSRAGSALEPPADGLVKVTLLHDELSSRDGAGVPAGLGADLVVSQYVPGDGRALPEMKALVERGGGVELVPSRLTE